MKYTPPILRFLGRISIVKTLYFNFKYFDFKTALKLPVFLSGKVDLYCANGSVQIVGKPYTGMFKFGISEIGTIDRKYERRMLELNGVLKVHGKVSIGAGSRISVDEGGLLELGDNFSISGRTTINANKHITFGNDCMLSWDIMIMDTDYHKIIDNNGNHLNPAKPITIGNHVWIGSRVVILKGVSVENNVVLAANSTLTRTVNGCNCIIGGNGPQAKIIKQEINWER